MDISIRSGDSYSFYSQLFEVPLNILIDSNQSLINEYLIAGKTMKIPGYIVEPYAIQQGDTLTKLMEATHISMDLLLLINPFLDQNNLEIGQILHLPYRIETYSFNRKCQYDFDILQQDLDLLKSHFPFLQINTIGESVLGKPIQEITIGRGEIKIQANASFHANEWITTPVLMQVLNDYCLALTKSEQLAGVLSTELYERTTLSIIPMVNPDGVDLVLNGLSESLNEFEQLVFTINKGEADFSVWKANIRGVDLNDQFPAKWETEKLRNGVFCPAPRDFPGKQPLTEPEALVMKEIAVQKAFDLILAFHTQGQEFYWGFEGLEPPESKLLAEVFEKVSGYKAIQYIESYGGYKDWFIQEFRRPAFTIELGYGTNPLPLSQFDKMYEAAREMILAALKWKHNE